MTLSRASISALAALGDATASEVAELVPAILCHSTEEPKDVLVAAWLVMTHHIPAHVALTHLDRWLDDRTSLGAVVTAAAIIKAEESGMPEKVRDALALEDAPPAPPTTERSEFDSLVCDLGDDELRVLLSIAREQRGVVGTSPSIAVMSRLDMVTLLRDGPYTRELSWLLFIARRLRMGQSQYGRLDLLSDRRDWEREAREERADEAVYRACAEVQAGMRAAS